MFETLLLVGVACVIGAVVGGGLKIANIEVPVVSSLRRQALLAAVGLAIIALDVAFVEGEDGGGRDGAELILSETSGPPGASLTVSGSGYGAGETARIRFHVNEVGTVQTDDGGRFSGKTIQIPSDWPADGQFDVVAVGEASGQVATAPFRVPPATLKLSRHKGPAGTQVTVTGSMFATGERVEISAHLTRVAEVRADGEGAFSAPITTPTLGPETSGFPDVPGGFPLDIVATGQTSRRVARQTFELM